MPYPSHTLPSPCPCQERADAFAKAYGVTRAYGSYEELAKDEEVEMVYVATLNYRHYALAKIFLQVCASY